MLFNSYAFILVFLPIVWLGHQTLAWTGLRQFQVVWLVLASVAFYAWWNVYDLPILLASVTFNYLVALGLAGARGATRRKLLLFVGIAGNLGALAWYKYANFISDNVAYWSGRESTLGHIVLPLAISFFTFQQIAYLVDTSRSADPERSFPRYALFVMFFPQLIAGPIVHHGEVRGQIATIASRRLHHADFGIGSAFFVAGLFKKVVFADSVAPFANQAFDGVAAGHHIGFFGAWLGALAYSAQLYFDFSGYSDMAVGLALMFGIRLPFNFNSPYKAVNIIDFWRRWHITLSSFLRDYLYIPLGGGRRGLPRRYVNLLITMLLGGLWHGAGWTFVAWGALHGLYLVINHGWHWLRARVGLGDRRPTVAGVAVGRAVTLVAVVFGWVLFRAESMDVAVEIMGAMVGLNGMVVPAQLSGVVEQIPLVSELDFAYGSPALFGGSEGVFWVVVLFVIALWAPNTQEWLGQAQAQAQAAQAGFWTRWSRRLFPHELSGAVCALLLGYALTRMSGVSQFLYFQF